MIIKGCFFVFQFYIFSAYYNFRSYYLQFNTNYLGLALYFNIVFNRKCVESWLKFKDEEDKKEFADIIDDFTDEVYVE